MKAQMLATMAALKNSCSPSSATKNVLQISNINVPKADPPCESYLTNSAPYEQLNIKIEMTSKNGFPNLLPANGNHFYIFTDGSKSNEGTGYAAILTSCRGITEQPRGRLSTINSVFEAEACAVATALKIAKDKPFGSTFSIFSDSRSVLQAFMSGRKTIPFMAKLQKKIMVYN